MSEADTQINRKFVEQWKWIPAALRAKFTPTAVISILIAAFSFGSAAATYRAKFHEAEKGRVADHRLLLKQQDTQSDQTKAIANIAAQLAHLDGTLQGLDRRLDNLEDWRNGIKQDVQDANQVRIPKLTNHRVKHPP